MDLVQQAGPRAVVEDGVLAGAQLEHALQDLHAPRTACALGKGRSTGACGRSRAPVVGHARKRCPLSFR